MFFEKLHIEIAVGFQPVFMGLRRQSPDQPQAAGLIREDPHHPGSPFDLLVETLQHVGGLQMLVVL